LSNFSDEALLYNLYKREESEPSREIVLKAKTLDGQGFQDWVASGVNNPIFTPYSKDYSFSNCHNIFRIAI